jgi:D-alanine-D-alanine ligase
MRKLKVLVLVHLDLVPPEEFDHKELETAIWKTEYDVISTLKSIGHEVYCVGVLGDLEIIRRTLVDFNPHIVFNLLEEFDGNPVFDQHVVSYLELKRIPYTGCNPRGLTLARDKALSKKILSYHRIPVPKFYVFPKNQKPKMRKGMIFPLIVKSLTEEASLGISQASIVHKEEELIARIEFIHQSLDTDAIAEQYIEGREFYVGVMGNLRLNLLPVWELRLENMPDASYQIATERVKWSEEYRKKYRIKSLQAPNLDEDDIKKIHNYCKKTYKTLGLNGYARIDLRYTENKKVYILEANPNPGVAYGEEFPDSAEKVGLTYEQVLEKIISLGLSWYRNRR